MSETNQLPEEPAPAAAPKKPPAKKKPPKKKPKKRARKPRYGVEPPLDFDITRAPRVHLLNLVEAARATRKTTQACRAYTRLPDPPLKFFKSRDGYWRTTVGDVLDFLNTPEPRNRSKR